MYDQGLEALLYYSLDRMEKLKKSSETVADKFIESTYDENGVFKEDVFK